MDTDNLYIYDTESRKQKKIELSSKGESLRIYACGPTVYNYAHIGNFRTYVFEDLLRRTLHYFGFSLFQVMNITDIDDKTIKGAEEKKISLDQYTKVYREAFFADLDTLNIERVEAYPAATEHIADMITMIEALLEKGFAYRGKNGDIFYAIANFPQYGRLSHLDLSALQTGASKRVSTDEYDKEAAADFVLWKAYDKERDGSVYWESPFGKGRPGWHIECSAMAMKLLKVPIDLHIGGVDNIFPHHENEIAQSEGCIGKQFVRHWIHCQHLIVDGKKMSKSLGNFYTLRDLLARGYSGREVRYLLLSTHYRTQLNFTFQGLEAARQSLHRLRDFIHRLRVVVQEKGNPIEPLLVKVRKQFRSALGEDINISSAIAALFELVRAVHSECDQKQLSKGDASKVLAFLWEIDQVLGVLPLEEEELAIPLVVKEAFAKREQAREEKNWEEADKQRAFIEDKGYCIEDSAQGSQIKKKLRNLK